MSESIALITMMILLVGCIVLSRATDERKSKRPTRAFIGATMGPVLAVLLSQARIGSPGFLWWEGKGGETFMTPLGRNIFLIVVVGGTIVGGLCGRAMDARSKKPGGWSTEFE